MTPRITRDPTSSAEIVAPKKKSTDTKENHVKEQATTTKSFEELKKQNYK